MTLNEFIGPDAGSSSPHLGCRDVDIMASHTGVQPCVGLDPNIITGFGGGSWADEVEDTYGKHTPHSMDPRISRTNRFASFRYVQSNILP
jgi:hypothetical protein